MIDGYTSDATHERLYRIASALNKCQHELDEEHKKLVQKEYPNAQRLPFFPEPTGDPPETTLPKLDYYGILNRTNNTIEYYSDPSVEEMRCIFVAKMDDTKDVVVKFAPQYGKEAHELLASKGLAPTLHCCECVVGGLYMIVMDRVEGRVLDSFEEGKRHDKSAFADLDAAVSALRTAGFVHGDLRAANIIINPSGKHANVIDFDWASTELDGNYPYMVSKKKLSDEWHPDVKGGAKMKTEHDYYALNNILKPKYFDA